VVVVVVVVMVGRDGRDGGVLMLLVNLLQCFTVLGCLIKW